ncbi:MAG: hypothetical protein ABGZ17_10280 [Planctomycetaceae bacterium]
MNKTPLWIVIAVVLATLHPGWEWMAVSQDTKSKPADKRSIESAKAGLADLNALIGGWRGTGQPRRGSSRGAWRENARWLWDFSDDRVRLQYDVSKGKLIKSGFLEFLVATQSYQLTVMLTDGSRRVYTGKLSGKKLVMESAPGDSQIVHRITVTRLNDKRSLVLYEQRRAQQSFYTRVAEVGYTREGTRLAVAGAGQAECVVSGGKGTMRVTHKGQTYYVCCTGCREAFNEDPDGVIADYKARIAERSKP